MTVTGPPLAICALKIGITLPAEPSTLPKRTVMKRVLLFWLSDWMNNSATRFETPITEVGFTALSVEIMTKRSTCQASASVAMVRVPRMLFFTASPGFHSIIGTCLWAAA